MAAIKTNELVLLGAFESTMTRLQTISAKELAQEPFSADDNTFIQELMVPGYYAVPIGIE